MLAKRRCRPPMVKTTTRWLLAGMLCLALCPAVAHAQAPMLERALEIAEEALGPHHPYVAMNITNLAKAYHAQGRYAEAEPLYQRALAIWEKALAPEHPHLAKGLQNYAALLRKTGRGSEATKMEARAKEIRAKHTGE